MERRVRKYSGVKSPKVSQREIKHREIAGYAATQGFVLLKNENKGAMIKSHCSLFKFLLIYCFLNYCIQVNEHGYICVFS